MKKLICYLFGHRWELVRWSDEPNGWAYEHQRCKRCGLSSRTY